MAGILAGMQRGPSVWAVFDVVGGFREEPKAIEIDLFSPG